MSARGGTAHLAIIGLLLAGALALGGCGTGGAEPTAGGGGTGGGGTGTATLSWEAPTTNADGSPLMDLAGYRIFHGTAPRTYTGVVVVADPNATEYTVGSLASGRHYFAMLAYDLSGNASEFSEEVFKDIP